jgi:hypothetical protein
MSDSQLPLERYCFCCGMYKPERLMITNAQGKTRCISCGEQAARRSKAPEGSRLAIGKRNADNYKTTQGVSDFIRRVGVDK